MENEEPFIHRPTIEELLAYLNDPVTIRTKQIFAESAALSKDQWKERFVLIREAYTLLNDLIMKRAKYGRIINPYFIEWHFSPIEYNAWCEIRGLALPFYPQYPVLGFFLDFADPYRKIAIELDGKEFHDAAKDAERDQKLGAEGWEVFRISGSMANRYAAHVLEEEYNLDEEGFNDLEEYEQEDIKDHLRRTTIDGFFKWLKQWFYTKEEIAEAANPTDDGDDDE